MSQSASTINGASPVATPLPEGWRRVHLRDAIREAQGGFASGERDAGGVIQLRMNNVTTSGQFDWSSYIRVPADSGTVEAYRLKAGDVLFNNTNSTELVGKSALFEGHGEPVVFSNHFTRLQTDGSLLEPSYLASWLRHQWQRHVFAEICNRWIGQSAVQRDKLLALEILLPPLHEQKRIAAILKEQMAAVERARAAAEAQLKAAKDLPAAYFHSAFSNGEARGWKEVKLGEVCKIQGGFAFRSEDYKPMGNAIIRISNIIDGVVKIDKGTAYVSNETIANLEQYKLKPGDVLLAMSGATTGKVGVVPANFPTSYLNQRVGRFKPSESRLDASFLRYYLTQPGYLAEIFENAFGAAIPNVSPGFIESLFLYLPPIEEQRCISHELTVQITAANEMRKLLQDRLDSINKLPAALLRQAFTGKL